MKKFKSSMAILLAVIMVASIMPSAVFAEEVDTTTYYEQTEEASLQAEQEAQWQAEQEAAARAEEEARLQAEQAAAEQAAAMQEAIDAAAEEAARQQAEQQQAIDEAQTYEEVWQEIDQAVQPEETTQEETVAETTEATTAEETTTEGYPAIDFDKIDLGDGASLTISSPKGALPEGTTVKVSELSAKDAKSYESVVKKAAGDDYNESRIFEVNFTKDDKAVTPQADVSMIFTKVKIDGEEASLYIVEKGKANLLDGPVAIKEKDGASFKKISAKGGIFAIASIEENETTTEEETEEETTAQLQLIDKVKKALSLATSAVAAKNSEEEIVETTTQAEETTKAAVDEEETETQAPSYPAFTANQAIAGTEMQISVDAPEGAFPENIRLFAGLVETPQAVLNAIESDAGGEVAAEDAVSIDVHFYLDEDPSKEIEPLIPINVTFSNINLDAETVDVYHETEKVAETSGEGGSLTLDEFSTYTFVPTEGTSSPIIPDETFTISDMEIRPVEGASASDLQVYLKDDGTDITPDPTYWRFSAGSNVTISDDGKVTPVAPGQETSSIISRIGGASKDFTITTYGLVKYDANGATAGTAPADQEYYDATSLIAPGRGDLTRSGYVFRGWSTDPGATTATYVEGDAITVGPFNNDPDSWVTTLYAVWEENPRVYIQAKKEWNDGGDTTYREPIIARVNANGSYARQRVLSDANSWTYTFGAVAQLKYDVDGNEINYTLVEKYPDGSTLKDHYDTVISEPRGTGTETDPYVYTITNTLKKDITISKVWDDDNDRDGIRPDSVEVNLTDASGAAVEGSPVTLDDTNGWAYTFTGLPAYDSTGAAINYTVSETETGVITGDADTGYASSVAADPADPNSFIVTNTHNPEKVEIQVTKNWDDDSNAEGKRPGNLYLRVFRDGEYVRQNSISTADDTKTVTITENPSKPELAFYKYHDGGTPYVYTVDESATSTGDIVEVENYEKEIIKDSDYSFTINNAYVPENTSVTIKKVWDDSDDADKKRPNSVLVRLMNNGEEVKSEYLNATKNWETTFTDIPVKDAAGNVIEYYVDEEQVAGYATPTITKDGTAADGYTFTVTNSYDSKRISIKASKVWNDDNNRDGLRQNVKLTLTGTVDGQVVSTAEQTHNTDYLPNFDFGSNKPVYYKGKLIEYTLTEEAIDGYTTEITSATDANGNITYTVTNTHEVETIDIPVTKVWNDGDNRDGLRPESITVALRGNGGNAGTLTLSEDNGWAGTFEGMPTHENGTEISYTVAEGEIEGYESAVSGDAEAGFTITNTHKPEVITSIPVSKVWEDADNQDGIRPETVYVRLYKADGTSAGKQKALSEANGWASTFNTSEKTPIYKYENGVEIEYTVVESTAGSGDPVAVEGYETEVTGNAADGFVVTNTHEPEVVSISVDKIWDDANDQDGVRPDEVYAVVLADGTRVRQRALNESNGWSTVIESEQQYKYKPGEQGVEIQYEVVESWEKNSTVKDDPEGNYTTEITGSVAEGFTITNSYEPEVINVNVSKVWDDDNNRDGKRPGSLEFTVLANGEAVESESVTVQDDGSAEVIFPSLPRYENGGYGIAYAVVETPVEGYTAEYASTVDLDTGNVSVEVTNSYDPEKTSIMVVKSWDDENNLEGIRPEEVTVNLLADGQPAKDETGAPISATLNAENGWAHIFSDIPKFAEEGTKTIKYSVEEEAVDGYEASYSDFADTGYITVKNTHEVKRIDITVKKYWDDNEDEAGIRESSKMHLEYKPYEGDAELYPDSEVTVPTASSTGRVTVTTYKDLPVYDENGTKMLYFVHEDDVPAGYVVTSELANPASKYTGEGGGADWIGIDAEKVYENGGKETATFKNKAVLIKNLSVIKTWDDDFDAAGKRAATNITVTKLGSAGIEVYATLPISTDEAQMPSLHYLPVYENGRPITYTVTEEPIEDYETKILNWADFSETEGRSITFNAEDYIDGVAWFEFTNTYDPKTKDITVNKVWEDGNNQDGIRPDSVTAEVVNADNVVVADAVLSEENNWTFTFTDLPTKDDTDTEIEYRVREKQTDVITERDTDTTYGFEVVDNGDDTWTITNTHTPKTITVSAKKVWDDDNNRDKKRPELITLHLLANGENIRSISTDQPTYDFTDLPAYKDGKEINYVVVESSVPDYTTSYVRELPDAEGNLTWTITNKYVPETTTITAAKAWDDDDNRDGKRPEYVTLRLQYFNTNQGTWVNVPESSIISGANGQLVSEENAWMAQWTVKTNSKTGKKLDFQVVEELYDEAADIYEPSYVNNNGAWTVTNTYKPETGSLQIKKVWDDDSNRDGLRPSTLNIYVTANGVRVPGLEKTLSGSGANWWYKFENLPLYENGELIEYAFEEDLPDGYTVDYGTPTTLVAGKNKVITVTNTHKPETITTQITKIWDDNDDQDGLRVNPQFKIVGYNTINGGAIAGVEKNIDFNKGATEPLTVSKDDNGNVFYKYYRGKPINYVLTEEEIDGYTTEIAGTMETGFRVINTHEPAAGSLTVIKKWEDDNNRDGMRPDSIQVTLTSDHDPSLKETVGLSAANGWTYTWDDLPVYHDGGEVIHYTVVEDITGSWTDHYDDTDMSEAKDIALNSEYHDAVITNTSEIARVNIHVTKVWDDENNHDKKRPAEITYTLFANGTAIDSKTLSSSNATWNIEGLPLLHNGRIIDYSVVEAPVDDYTTTRKVTVDHSNSTINVEFTNKRENEKTTITAIKEWDDDDDRDGVRPDSVDFILQYRVAGTEGDGGWAGYSQSTRTKVSDANNWQCSWTVNTVNNKGQKLEWRIVEAPTGGRPGVYTIPDYPTELRVIGQTNGVFTVKNVHVPEKAAITFTKVWDDDSNREGLRPASLSVALKANGAVVNTAEVTGTGDTWTYEFKDLPVNENGEKIAYTIEEVVPEGYTAELPEAVTLTAGETADYTVTNIHESESIQIPVKKVWDDSKNQDGKRPEAITGHLKGYVDGKVVVERDFDWGGNTTWESKTTTLTKDNDKKTLYKYYEGKEISYVVTEDAYDGYTTTIEGDAATGFTVTNTHEPETISITVEKVWDDDNNRDGVRPEHVQIALWTDDRSYFNFTNIGPSDNWQITFENLPKYKLNEAGESELIEYDVDEFTFLDYNTYMPSKEDISDEIYPDGDGKYFLITNTHVPETLDIEVNKFWDDNSNQDGKRPADGATFTLMADGIAVDNGAFDGADDQETYMFNDLPVYENGQKIVYSVVEQSIKDYTAEIEARPMFEDAATGKNKQVFAITNTHNPGMTTLTVNKVWDDADNQDGVRPDEVAFDITGTTEQNPAAFSIHDFLNEANGWAATYDVPTHDQGYPIQYSIEESEIPDGYTASDQNIANAGNFVITNTHEPATGSLQIKKVWDDDSNRDGLRPNSLKINVLANGVRVPGLERIITGSGVNWWYKYENLPLYENGELIKYSFEEEVPEGYTVTYPKDATLVANKNRLMEVTNTHEPETITTKITKIWDDNDNQDGLRVNPQFKIVGYNTINGGAIAGVERNIDFSKDAMEPLTVSKDDNGNVFYKNYKGKPINYVLTEAPIEGYTTEIAGSMEEGFKVTNTHEPKLIDVTVTKAWDDEEDRDGLRPEYLEVTLKAGDENAETVRLSAENNWSHVFKDLYACEDGEEIEYSVEEADIPGYTLTSGEGATVKGESGTIELVNQHTPAKIKITVNKKWDDDNNRDGKRPTAENAPVFTLLGNNRVVDEKDVPLADGEVTFEDLYAYENGEPITYNVTESSINDYTTEIIARPLDFAQDGTWLQTFDVTNTHTPGMKSVTVVKVWDDDNDRDGLRNEDTTVLNITLAAKGGVDQKYEGKLSKENNWAYIFDVYTHKDGQELVYEVTEENVPAGYTASYSDFGDGNGFLTITNTHVPATGSLQIKKVWDDDSNRDGLRPNSLTINVLANGVRVPGLEREITGKGVNWWYKYENLPLYENGELIKYNFEEDVPEGYTVTYPADATLVADKNRLMEVTNTHEPETITTKITKIWDDNDDQDGLRVNPQFKIVGYNTINGGAIAGVERNIDFDKSVTEPLTVSKDDSGNVFYKNYKGKPINYVLTEEAIDGYETTIEGSMEEGFKVTNTHEPATGSLSVIKDWDDADNQDGYRPDSLLVTLSSDADSDLDADVGLSAANGWTYTWENLPVYHDGGELVKYSVEEHFLGAWTAYYEADQTSAQDITLDTGDDAIITNTHEPEKTEVKVIKHWDDENNHDKVRPASIDITLFADGTPVKTETISGDKETDENWSITFGDLDKYKNGKEIVYTVSENSIPDYVIASVDQYVDRVEVADQEAVFVNTFEITNEHKPGMTTITAVKEWDDDDDRDGIRPEEVEVELQWRAPADAGYETFKSFKEKKTLILNEANTWTASWDVYTQREKTGSDMEYRVIEPAVPEGYEASISELDGVWTVKNTHKPAVGDLKVWKVWEDDSNRDGLRPAAIDVYVTANGARLNDKVVSLSGLGASWQYTFKDLPLYEDGELISYGFQEVVPDGYTAAYGAEQTLTEGGSKTIKITNTHKAATIQFPVTKIWDDQDDNDGIRPDKAEFTLKGYIDKSGSPVVTRDFEIDKTRTTPLIITSDNDGNPLYAGYTGGLPITYVLEEKDIEGYTKTIEGNVTTGFIVTNTHEIETGSLSVIKEWDDAEDQDGYRPDSILVTLSSDADPDLDADVGISAANGWTYTWENLPVYYDGGKLVQYTVEEDLDGAWSDYYEADQTRAEDITLDTGNDAIITNTHEPEKTEVKVIKHWDDENNHDKVRPASIDITLFADGTPVRTEPVSGDTETDENWSITFGDLDKYKNGKEIVYTVSENSIPDYVIASVDHYEDRVEVADQKAVFVNTFEITNEHKPGMTTITAVKQWDDDDDRDDIRPEEVEVELQWRAPDDDINEFRSFKDKKTLILNEANTWTASWDVYTQREKTGSDMEYRVIEPTAPNGYEASYSELNGVWTVKNTHVPATTDITVTKKWLDGNNYDQIRPDSINLQLMANGKAVAGQIIRLSAENADPADTKGNTWTDVVEDLYVYENGEVIDYTVLEDVIEGYETTITGTAADEEDAEITVTNTHMVETTNVTATKIWEDAEDQDGFRTDAKDAFRFKLRAFVNGEEVEISDIHDEYNSSFNDGTPYGAFLEEILKLVDALTGANDPKPISDGTVSWMNLPKTYDGNEITYKVEEIVAEDATDAQKEAAAKYTAAVEETAPNIFEVTNTHEPETFQFNIIKTWEDDDDRDGIRPDTIPVMLAGGDIIKIYVLTEGEGWTLTTEELPKYKDGELIEYTLLESVPEGYEETTYGGELTEKAEADMMYVYFNNLHEPEKLTIEVDKIWNDNSNQDGVRPDDGATITLLADGIAVEQGVFQGTSNEETITFEGLPVNANGKQIAYSVAEQSIDNYTADIEARPMYVDNGADGQPETGDEFNKQVFAITNTHVPGVKDVTVVKEWDDEDDFDGIRPDKVTVALMADGEAAKDAAGNELTAELTEDIGWTYTFKSVPINKEGKAIDYTVVENEVPTDYEVSYTNLGGEGGYITVTNKHEVKRTYHTVKIEWDDNDNQDGLRPEYVNVYLLRNGERVEDEPVVTLSAANGWTYTWTDLPAADYSTKTASISGGAGFNGALASARNLSVSAIVNNKLRAPEAVTPGGSAIGYSADEITNLDPAVYTKTSVKTEGNVTTIVNTYRPKTIAISGHKFWDDNSNQDGKRPESVTINLYADGDLIKTQEITAANADSEDGNSWKYEFTDLPRYIDGHLVHYQVSEAAVANYTPRIVGFDIYNSYTPGKTFVTVIKLWDDDINRDGIRPENVVVHLLADGEEIGVTSVGTGNAWFDIFTGLDVMNGGKEIKYTIKEDPVEGYTSAVSGDQTKGFILTNTHAPETIDLTINKVWDDNNDKAKLRPNSITANVVVNGVKVETRTLSAAEGWKTTVTGLPKNYNGAPIAYTVTEDPVIGYNTTVSGTTITNTIRPDSSKVSPDNGGNNSNKGSSGGSGSSGKTAPKTGDTAPVTILIVVLVVAAAAIASILIYRRKKNKGDA